MKKLYHKGITHNGNEFPIVRRTVDSYQLTAIVILLMVVSLFAYDYTNWQYSLSLVINTKGIGVTEDVTNFPLLIRLTPENAAVFTNAKNNGEDIRFSKSDGSTPLPYQIEKWDKVSQQATIWVKVDAIYGNNDEQAIVMYYGNSAAASESNDANVFGSIDYSGVWHLNDMDDASRPSGSDYDGTNNGTVYIPGIIGDGVKFEGADWIDISTAAFSGVSSQISLEFWAYGGTGMPKDSRLVWSRDSYGNRTLNVVLPWSDESVVYDAGNSGGYFNRIEKLATASEYKGTWGHWVFTKNSSTGTMRIYYNGVLWYSEESGNTYQIHIQNGFRIGADNYGSLNWEGRLDEFRASKVARSAAWVKLSYESQKQNQELVGFGSCRGCSAEYWQQSGNDIFYLTVPEQGNVIIGAMPTEPTDKRLQVFGKSYLSENVGIGMEPTGGTAKLEVSGQSTFKDGDLTLEEGSLVLKGTENQIVFKNIEGTDVMVITKDLFRYDNLQTNDYTQISADNVFMPKLTVWHTGQASGPKSVIENGDITTDGTIKATEITVTDQPWSDFVFSKDFKLTPLEDLEKYIKENGHLPGILKEQEIKEKGLNIGDMQAKLLEKIEEMTLYLIEIKKENQELKTKIGEIEKK